MLCSVAKRIISNVKMTYGAWDHNPLGSDFNFRFLHFSGITDQLPIARIRMQWVNLYHILMHHHYLLLLSSLSLKKYLLVSSILLSLLHDLFRLKLQQFLDLLHLRSKWILCKFWDLTLKSSPVRTRYKAESMTSSGNFLVVTVIVFVCCSSSSLILFSFLSQELQFDLDNNVHHLDIAPLKIDVGKYALAFEVLALLSYLYPISCHSF